MAMKKDTLDGLLQGRDPHTVSPSTGYSRIHELESLAERVLKRRSKTIWTAKRRRAVRMRAHFPTVRLQSNCCISSCARSRRHGKCRHARNRRGLDPIRHHVRRQVR